MKKKWTFSPKSNLCGKGVLAKASILLLFCFVFQLNAYAVEQQQRNSVVEARGKVVDAYDQPVIGATVMLRGSFNIGSGTDVNGNFVVVIPASTQNPYLVVSSVGKKEVEVPFRGQALTIKMEDDLRVEGVIVQPTSPMTKEQFTGDARVLTADDLKQAGGGSLMQAIANIDPSFKIAENIEAGYNPNMVPEVSMRSSQNLLAIQEENKLTSELNRPLFIQDQFRISAEEFMNLNENLVESITLLKDASATALYGSDGANGVVVITMKKPNPGELRVTYNGTLGFIASDLSSFNLMDSREKLRYERNAGLYSAGAVDDQLLMDQVYNARKTDVERGVDTYWIRYPVKASIEHNHSLSVSGGDNAILYTVSAQFASRTGGTKGLKNNNFNVSKQLQYNIENFTFSNSLSVTNVDAYNSNYNIGVFSRMNSYFSPYDENGAIRQVLERNQKYFVPGMGAQIGAGIMYNPLYDAKQPFLNENNNLRIRNNFSVVWQIIPKELRLNAGFGISTERYTSDVYRSRNTSGEINRTQDTRYRGRYERANRSVTSYDGSLSVTYDKTLNIVHGLHAGLRMNLYSSSQELITNVYEGFTNPDLGYPLYAQSYARASGARPSGSNPKYRRISASLEASYVYDRRYNVQVSTDLNGNSQFREDKRYSMSWTVGVGWTIANEKFLEHSNFVDRLRLVANYGQQGAQSGSMNDAFTMYQHYRNLTYKGWFGMELISFGNEDLEAEKTYRASLKMEYSLWRGRISGNVSVHQYTSHNRFHSMDVNPTSGFTTVTINDGKSRLRGADVDLSLKVIDNRAKRIEWTVGGSLRAEENKLIEMNGLDEYNKSLEVVFQDESRNRNPAHMLKVGEALSTNFVVISKGIDPSTGREIFIDRFGNETFVWDAKDRQAFHQSDDKVWGNLNTRVTFRNWTLQAYMSWNTGGWVENSTLMSKVENTNPRDNADKRALYDRWQQAGDKSYFKRVTDLNNTRSTSRFMMRNNRLQMTSINLRYRVPTTWSQKHLGLSNITLEGNVTDIFYTSTIKRERGINDPFTNQYRFKLDILF